MKRLFTICLSILVLILFTGCTKATDDINNIIEIDNKEKVVYEASVMHMSVEEAFEESNSILSSELIELKEYAEYREYQFSVIRVIKGTIDASTIFVREGYGAQTVIGENEIYSTVDSQYNVGNKYILVLSKLSSVYNDHDYYSSIADIFIEIDDDSNIISFQQYHKQVEASFKNENELKSYISENIDMTKEPTVYGFPFTDSEDLQVIVDSSQYIVKAVVGEIAIQAPNSNRDTYTCKITENIKGVTPNEILVVLLKDTVVIGEEYLLLLNTDTPDSLIYAISSINSVLDLETEKSVVDEIISLVVQ